MKETKQIKIALSAGGLDSELAEDGIGMEHIDELMIRLSMRLLEAGHHLAFGGALSDKEKRLTDNLISTGQRWSENKDMDNIDVNAPETWPLVNYSSWHYYKNIDPTHRANLIGLCRFVEVDARTSAEKSKCEGDVPLQKRLIAETLTKMRELVSKDSALRIVWGGKIRGSSGWIAGILEEVASSLELNKPVLILGGFGGCSKLIARFLSKKTARWPEDLSLEACADPERDAIVTAQRSRDLKEQFVRIQMLLRDYREQLHSKEYIHNLPVEKLCYLLTSDNPRQSIQTVVELVERLKVSTLKAQS